MKNQTYRMTMLYDFYGDLMTERQKEFYDLYYNEDLSLAEIAENYGITRQGVRDIIIRGEAMLQNMEEKTGLIKRHQLIQDALEKVDEGLSKIQALNHEKLENAELQNLCEELSGIIQGLGGE